jgi:hypothetical protein
VSRQGDGEQTQWVTSRDSECVDQVTSPVLRDSGPKCHDSGALVEAPARGSPIRKGSLTRGDKRCCLSTLA